MGKIRLLPIEKIKTLYYEECLPIYAIAEKLKCDRQTISRKLCEAGCALRSNSESEKMAYQMGRKVASHSRERRDITDTLLRKLYWDEKLSTVQIAKQLNCSTTLILWRFKQLGIPTRDGTESQKLSWAMGLRGEIMLERNPSWKGGRYLSGDGYVYLLSENKKKTGKRKYIPEHRLVWEQTHGRKLPQGYIIHHLNGIKNDNRPSNLVAMKLGEHVNQTKPYKQRIRELEIENRQLRRALEDSQMIFYISEN